MLYGRSHKARPIYAGSFPEELINFVLEREEPGNTSSSFFVSIEELINFGLEREEPGNTFGSFFVSIEELINSGGARKHDECVL